MYFRRKQSQGRFYLQIVESHRTGDRVRQRVIATLGRLDELESSGQLDRLLRSGARFVRQAMVLDAARSGDAPAIAVRHIGPALLFERLWQETGCQDVIAGLARKRGHHFAVERAVFLTVLHRLMRGCAVGSRGCPNSTQSHTRFPPSAKARPGPINGRGIGIYQRLSPAAREAQMFAQRISRRIIPLAVTCVAVIGTATSAASEETISIALQTATKLIAEDGHAVTRVSLSTSAETVKVSDKASTDGSFRIAQTQGMNRRADRRDSRQDCRHQEGAVGADKRNCKQQRRQTRGSSPPG